MRSLIAGATVAALLAGCGGDPDDPAQPAASELAAADLVRYLPQDARIFSTADLDALKEGMGLPSSADPYSDRELIGFTSAFLGGLYAGFPRKAVVDALALPSASALASSSSSGEEPPVTAVATPADPAEIRSTLLDLGFVERGGVLEGPNGAPATHGDVLGRPSSVTSGGAVASAELRPADAATAVRFVDGGFLVSDDGDLLRSLSSPADELPLQVQSSLRGDATQAALVETKCIVEQGVATNADGSGELVFVLDAAPDPSRFSALEGGSFREATVDGSQLVVPIDLDSPESPGDLLAEALPGYDCSG